MNDRSRKIAIELAALTEEQRQLALERFQLLRPCLDEGISLAAISRQHRVALRTAERWFALYRDHGLVGLARQPRNDRGRHRRVTPDVKALIEGMALRRPRPTAAFVHRQIVALASERGWQPPSYRSVCEIVKRLDPAMVTLAHDGPKAYQNAFDLIHRRDATKPNEIWQADHCKLDIYLLNDKAEPERPWLTVILDDCSRAIAGFTASFRSPSVFQTALVLRQAIWRKVIPHWHVCGIPDVFYTDHGSDFISNHMEQVSADLKMALVFSQVGVPRGRGKIERFFRTLNQLFLCRLPGYAPDGALPKGRLLPLSAFEAELGAFILKEYHHRVHGETRAAPQAHWKVGGFLPRLPESLEQLDLLLLTVAKARQVRPDGVHFHGFRYLDATLAAYVGESVIIRYDPSDIGEIRVFYQDRFLCRAICPELAGVTIPLRDLVQARRKRKQELTYSIRQRAKLVDTLLDVHRHGHSFQVVHEEAAPTPAASAAPSEASKLRRYLNE